MRAIEFLTEGDKMSSINLAQALANTPPVWKKFISSLPPQLAREFVDERPVPNQEDIDWFTPLRLKSPQPVAVSVADLLRHPENQGSIGRSPDDVIDAVNQQWGLKIPSGKKYDPNPSRYRAYSQMTPGTASPSVAVDGVIIFGAGRFVAAALRGDKTMRVWDMTREQGVAEGKLIESAVFLNPTTVIVGQAHGQPLELSPNTLKQIQAIAAKHGAYYEGNGTDRTYTKGQIDRYVGSWDDEVAKTASPNDPIWLYVLFANVDANNRVQRVGVDPKDTIFNRLLATAKDNSFQSIGYTSQALQKFLQMSSEGKYDFVKMSQQPATQENLTRFLKAGEALMWPSNWEQYPNKAGKIAKAATVDVRDQYLATRKAGVYVTGSGHLKAVQNITGKQGVAEGIDDSANLSRLQSVQSGRTALGLVNLPVTPSNDNPNNTAKVVNTGDRIMAVLNVRGVNIPFYISTGGGGKASVPTGKWYPVFGIHSSGWLNKGTEESINKFYGSKELARGAEILNKYLGDLRSVEDKIPLMKSDGYSIINKNLKPMSWHEVDSNVTEFKKRINAVLVQIGDAPHYPEVEYSKNDKKSQIVHLQNLAKFYPNITMKDFINQGKEKIINDAMLEVNQLKNYYGQNKQANFVQLLSNLENDINSFKRGSLANTNNQNSVPNLSLLLKGTLGKINFSTP